LVDAARTAGHDPTSRANSVRLVEEEEDATAYHLYKLPESFPSIGEWRVRLLEVGDTGYDNARLSREYVQPYIHALNHVAEKDFPKADKTVSAYIAEITHLVELLDTVLDVHRARHIGSGALATLFVESEELKGALAAAGARLLEKFTDQYGNRPASITRAWWLCLCRLRRITVRLFSALDLSQDDRGVAATLFVDLYKKTTIHQLLEESLEMSVQCAAVANSHHTCYAITPPLSYTGEALQATTGEKNDGKDLAKMAARASSEYESRDACGRLDIPSGIQADRHSVSELFVDEVVELLSAIHTQRKDVRWTNQMEVLVMLIWERFNDFLFDPIDAQAYMAHQTLYCKEATYQGETSDSDPLAGIEDEIAFIGIKEDDDDDEDLFDEAPRLQRLRCSTVDMFERTLVSHLHIIRMRWVLENAVYEHMGWAPHQYYPAGLVDGVSPGGIAIADTTLTLPPPDANGEETMELSPNQLNCKASNGPCSIGRECANAIFDGLLHGTWGTPLENKSTLKEFRSRAIECYLRPGDFTRHVRENPTLTRIPNAICTRLRTHDEYIAMVSFIWLNDAVPLALGCALNQASPENYAQTPAAEREIPPRITIDPHSISAKYAPQVPVAESYVIETLIRASWRARVIRGRAVDDKGKDVIMYNAIYNPNDGERQGGGGDADAQVADIAIRLLPQLEKDELRRRERHAKASAAAAASGGKVSEDLNGVRGAAALAPIVPSNTELPENVNKWFHLEDAYYASLSIPTGRFMDALSASRTNGLPVIFALRGEYWVVNGKEYMLRTRNAGAALAAFVRRCAFVNPQHYRQMLTPSLLHGLETHAELTSLLRTAIAENTFLG
jgi:hypothetical protein